MPFRLTSGSGAAVLDRRWRWQHARINLDDLARALDHAAQGRGRTVLLVRRGRHRQDQPVASLRRCHRQPRPRVRWPLRRVDHAARARPVPRHGPPSSGASSPAPVDDRDAVIDVLIMEMSFRQRPAVVIVEDLHWADHASLDVARCARPPRAGAAGRTHRQLPRRSGAPQPAIEATARVAGRPRDEPHSASTASPTRPSRTSPSRPASTPDCDGQGGRRQPVLPQRGDPRRRCRRAGVGPRRGPGPRGYVARGGPGRAGPAGGRADRG